MARRWTKIGAGVAGTVTTILGLFLLLQTNFGFEIIDLTGNFSCEGTYDNPCISEFIVKNPTRYDVDIFNQNEIQLDFSPDIKDYALFTKDGRCGATGSCRCELDNGQKIGYDGWRCVDFTEETKPRQDKVYVFRFPRYSEKNFLLVGIKNNPNDVIKWGFGANEEYLDPVWDSPKLIESSYKNFHADKFQKIETDYITFELPKTATHYWGTNETLDTYEVIISNFSIEKNSDYILKFTWQDERYISEDFQIHYDFVNNELITESISYNSLSKYNKTCMDDLDNLLSLSLKDDCLKDSKEDTSKLTFQNMTIELGVIESYNYKEEYNETCLYNLKNETNYLRDGLNYSRDNRENYTERKYECLLKVAYPVYRWSNFDKITTKDIPKDFLAIDDVAVSACGTLNTAGETYNQDQDIDADGSGDCIIIDDENITYNGNGHYILGDFNSDVIVINSNGAYVKNTNITAYDGSKSSQNYGIKILANNTYIFNNSIFGRADDTDEPEAGIYAEFVKNIRIESNYIDGRNGKDIQTGIGAFDDFTNSNNITIVGNVVDNMDWAGIIVADGFGSNINISYNNISNMDVNGIIASIETNKENLTINNNILNNIGSSSSDFGILVSGGVKNLSINNNILNHIHDNGIDLGFIAGGTIENNVVNNSGISGGEANIYIDRSSNLTISGNNVSYSVQGAEIYLEDSSDNTLISNNFIIDYDFQGYYAIWIMGGSRNTIKNHIMTGNIGSGIVLTGGTTNNFVENNTIIGSDFSEFGILNEQSSNYNTITNNTIASIRVGFEIWVLNSNDNNFTNNIIENCTFNCVYISSGDRNIFNGGIISDSVRNLIKIDESGGNGDSEFNEFRNLVLTNSTVYDIELLEDSNKNTFLNVTFNASKVNIPDGQLTVQWYLDAQVNDSVTLLPLEDVNVSGGYLDTSGVDYDSRFSVLTDSNGDIPTQEYTSYRNYNGVITNYNITFSKLSHTTNSTNYTGNLNLNILLDALPTTITIQSPTASQIFIQDNPTTEFNITISSPADECRWSEDSGVTNYTLIRHDSTRYGLVNTTMVDGLHTIVYSCNESSSGDWISSDSVSFDVDSVNVTVCRDLTVSREYELRNNIESIDKSCISIQTNNIVLDGNENNITLTSQFTSDAIAINSDGNTIKNISNIFIIGIAVRAISFSNGADGALVDVGTIITQMIGGGQVPIGLYFTNSDNNIIYINKIEGIPGDVNNGYGFYFWSNSKNNVVFVKNVTVYSHSVVMKNTAEADFFNSFLNNGPSTEDTSILTLINTTYGAGASEDVIESSIVIRKWYFQPTINDSNGNLENAAVNITNVTDDNIFSGYTDSNGQLPIQNLTEYVNDGTRTYNTPHTMDVSKAGYNLNSTTYNLTEVNNNFPFILMELVSSTCTYPGSGNWNILCSDNCLIGSPVDIDGNIIIQGAGKVILTSTLNFNSTGQEIVIQDSGCELIISSGGKIT